MTIIGAPHAGHTYVLRGVSLTSSASEAAFGMISVVEEEGTDLLHSVGA